MEKNEVNIRIFKIVLIFILLLSCINFVPFVKSAGLIPIARFDTVPYQRINSGEVIDVGVVAFSKEGINRVEFNISGQGYSGVNPLVSYNSTLNPQTGVYEYWVPINASNFTSDGQVQIDAKVYGNDGGIKDKNWVLQGTFNSTYNLSCLRDSNYYTCNLTSAGLFSRDMLYNNIIFYGTNENWWNGSSEIIRFANSSKISFRYSPSYVSPLISPTIGGKFIISKGFGLDPLILNVNPTGSLPQPVAYVSTTGNDATGAVNNASYPYASIGKAILGIRSWMNSNGYGLKINGGVVKLAPGNYSMTNGGFGSYIPTENEWLTITSNSALGGNKSNTYVKEGTIVMTRFVKLSNLTIATTTGGDAVSYSSDNENIFTVWTDNCNVIGNTRYVEDSTPISTYRPYYTNTYFTNMGKAVTNAILARNVTIEHIGDDAVERSPMTVNVHANDIDPQDGSCSGGGCAHADCWQWYEAPVPNNMIIYNYQCTNATYQGIFTSVPDDENFYVPPVEGVAIVNVVMNLIPPRYGAANAWSISATHMLLWHNSFDYTLNFWNGVLSNGSNAKLNIINFSSKGNLFSEVLLNAETGDNNGGDPEAPGVSLSDWKYNHYNYTSSNCPSVYFCETPGTNVTTGNANIIALRPQLGSVLIDRLPYTLVPVDTENTLRDSRPDIGAYEYVSGDTSYPVFSGYLTNNASLIGNGIGRFNVTLTNTNGTVLLEINGQNITARNNSGSATVFNATYNFTSAGTYSYKWHSWGNGTSHNYNVSETRSYTVNFLNISECNDGIDNDGDGLIDWQYDLGCYGINDTTETALSRDSENNWTTYNLSVSARVIYVSSSSGNDSWSGYAPEWNGTDGPKKTVSAGKALVRQKSSDWLLFKRGDSWKDQSLGDWNNYNGISTDYPIIIASYGNSTLRPQFNVSAVTFFSTTQNVSNLSLLGLYAYAYAQDPKNIYFNYTGIQGLFWLADGGNFLMEDCKLEYLPSAIQNFSGQISNISLRRNIFLDSYSLDSHAQGIFTNFGSPFLMEENLFYHNGWNDEFRLALWQPNNNISSWNLVTNGAINITIYNETVVATGLNFSSALNMSQVALIIQNAINSHLVYGNITFNWTLGGNFILKTSSYPSSSNYFISLYSGPGTDISLNTLLYANSISQLEYQGSPESTIFNRNRYISHGLGNATVRRNIDADGASGGLQLRMGGILDNDLFLQDPIGITIGSGENNPKNVSGSVTNNVILGTRDVDTQPQGTGIYLYSEINVSTYSGASLIKNLNVSNNIIAHSSLGTGNIKGISLDGPGEFINLDIHDNIVYDWTNRNWSSSTDHRAYGFNYLSTNSSVNSYFRNNIIQQVESGFVASSRGLTGLIFANNKYYSAEADSDAIWSKGWFDNSGAVTSSQWTSLVNETNVSLYRVNFTDSSRDINTYMASIGETPSYSAFINRTLNQSRFNWQEKYTAIVVNDYIRAGFTPLTSGDTTYPQFSNYRDNNGSLVGSGTGLFNVTLANTNGTVILTFNNQNYTALNNSGNATTFNVSVPSITAGTYSYNWISYGNGTSHNYNISNTRSYTVNSSDIVKPYFTAIPANTSINYTQGFGVDFNATDLVGFGTFAINYTTLFSINSSGWLKNSTPNLAAGNYYINVTINDTSNNLNSTIYFVNVSKATISLGLSATTPITYGTATNFAASESGCPTQLTCSLNITDRIFSAGTISANYSTSGNANYSAASTVQTVTINKAIPNIVSTVTTPIIYGTTSDFTCSGTNSGASDLTYNLNQSNRIYGVGTVYVNCSTSGGQNYTGNSTVKSLVINKATPAFTYFINSQTNNISIAYPQQVNASAYTNAGTIAIYRDGINKTNENGINVSLAVGNYTYIFNVTGNQNYSDISSKTMTVNVTDNTLPQITISTPLNNTNSTDVNLDVNYTVSDNVALSACWYSNDTYSVNTTLPSCTANITSIIWSQGKHNVTIWANDTSNNVNFSRVSFTIDSIPPYFTNLANKSMTIAQSLNYDINATDNGVGVQSFAINWTNTFSIDHSTGILTNISSLPAGDYYLNVSVNDTLGNLNSSILFITVTLDTLIPQFSNYQDNNGSLNDSGVGLFNVTLVNTNGTVLLEINGQNVTARNNSGSATVFNATYNFTTAGVYSYQWHSWGNGTSHNYNVSETRSYTVNSSDIVKPYFTAIPANTSINYAQGFGVDFNATDLVGFGTFAINYTTLFSINSSGWLTNSTPNLAAGNYYINVTINDTSNNLNSTIYFVNVSKAISKTSLTFDKTSPQVYGTAITPTCSIITGGIETLSLTNGTSGIAETLGAGNWSFNCSYPGNQNYTSSSNFTFFNITKATPTFTYFINSQTNNISIAYPQQVNASAYTNAGTIFIYRNNTDKTSENGINVSLAVGNYTYIFNVTGNQNYSDISSKTMTVNVTDVPDTTSPLVSLISPADNSIWTSSSTVDFFYNVTDASPISNCSLIINGTLDQTSSSITRNVSQTFSKSLVNSIYNWSINCTDNSNNQGNSSTYSLTVTYVPSSSSSSSGSSTSSTSSSSSSSGSSSSSSTSSSGSSGGTVTQNETDIILGVITKLIPFITSKNPGIIENSNTTFAINRMQIETIYEMGNVEVIIIRYKDKPLNTTSPGSEVYHYLEIKSKNLIEPTNTLINFRTDKNWISGEGINKENIALFHFNDSSEKWNEVHTIYSNEDENYYYYNATINSFSYFYVGESLSVTINPITKFFNIILNFLKTNIFWIIIGVISTVILVVLTKLIPKIKKKIQQKRRNIPPREIKVIKKPIIEHKQLIVQKPAEKPAVQSEIELRKEPAVQKKVVQTQITEHIKPVQHYVVPERQKVEKEKLREEINNLRKEIMEREKTAEKKKKRLFFKRK